MDINRSNRQVILIKKLLKYCMHIKYYDVWGIYYIIRLISKKKGNRPQICFEDL